MDAPETSYHGSVFRQTLPKHAEISDRSLAASARTGGRFNPTGEFGALYVSLDPETPLRELRRQVASQGTDLLSALPRTLFACYVSLQRVLDLRSSRVRGEWGLSEEDLHANSWDACQPVARRARDAGWEAIRFPSATGEGENLAIFVDRLHAGSYVQLLNEERLRPDLP